MNRYKELRGLIKSGDPVLFSGKGAFSIAIKLATLSPWSHVGVALWSRDVWDVVKGLPELGGLEDLEDRILLLESITKGKLPDVLKKKPVKGVQLVRLSDRILTYNGDMIGFRPTQASRENIAEVTKNFIEQHHGTPYEENKWQLLQSGLDLFGIDIAERQPDTSSLFCSELTAEFWMAMRWLDSQRQASNEYIPKDFASDDLPISSDVSLGRVTLLRD